MAGWGDSPKEVRDRLARLEQDRKDNALRQARALKAASDRIKAKQDDEKRARAHEIVRQNLNRPF